MYGQDIKHPKSINLYFGDTVVLFDIVLGSILISAFFLRSAFSFTTSVCIIDVNGHIYLWNIIGFCP